MNNEKTLAPQEPMGEPIAAILEEALQLLNESTDLLDSISKNIRKPNENREDHLNVNIECMYDQASYLRSIANKNRDLAIYTRELLLGRGNKA